MYSNPIVGADANPPKHPDQDPERLTDPPPVADPIPVPNPVPYPADLVPGNYIKKGVEPILQSNYSLVAAVPVPGPPLSIGQHEPPLFSIIVHQQQIQSHSLQQ